MNRLCWRFLHAKELFLSTAATDLPRMRDCCEVDEAVTGAFLDTSSCSVVIKRSTKFNSNPLI